MFVTGVFENIVRVSTHNFHINPIYCVSVPGFTWLCGLKYIGINSQLLRDNQLFLILENFIGGGISSVLGASCVKSDKKYKTFLFRCYQLLWLGYERTSTLWWK